MKFETNTMLPIGPSNPPAGGVRSPPVAKQWQNPSTVEPFIYSLTQLSKDFAIVVPAAEMERRPFTGWPDRGVQVAFEVKGTVFLRALIAKKQENENY